MSDRLPQQGFSMMPNFNSAMLQHQMGQAQQQQPNQLDANQARQAPGFNQQDNRLWAQMQHAPGQSFRPQSADMQNTQATNQQIADIMRQSAQVRAQQAAAQGQVPHQAFAQQIAGAQNQFTGQNNALATQGLNNNPMTNNMNLPPNMLNNRAALMQQSTNPDQMRQLELLNQTSMNGAANFNRMGGQLAHQSGMNPQPGQPQPSQNDIFNSPALTADNLRASPAQGQSNAIGAVRAGGQPGRPVSQAELRERIRQCRDSLTLNKKHLAELNNNRAGMPDAAFALQAARIRQDMTARETYYKRLCLAYQSMEAQQNGAASHSNMMAMNGNQPNPAANAQNQAWLQSMQNNGRQQMNMGQINGSPPNVQPSPSQAPSQATPPVHNTGLPPSASTPLQQAQIMQSQFSNQHMSSPPQGEGGQQHNPQQQQQRTPQFGPIALEKPKFDEIFHNLLRQKNIQIDQNMLNVSGRLIDLYDLHRTTQELGGIQKVMSQELWPAVGARMGYVQFPASDTEPAKAGPAVAQALKVLYTNYLIHIDKLLMTQMINARQRMALLQQQNGAQQQASNANAVRAMELATQSVQQLRAQGVPEQTIQFIEQNRAQLLRNSEQQSIFRGQVKGAQPQPPQPGASSMAPGNEAEMSAPNVSAQPGANNAYPGFRPPNQPGNVAQPNNPPVRPFLTASHQERADMLQNSQNMIRRLKVEASRGHTIPPQSTHEVPHEHRHSFNSHIEFLHNIVMDIEQKLPMVACIGFPEDKTRQLVSVITLIYQQRAGLSVNPPRYICDLPALQRFKTQLAHAKEFIDRHLLQYQQQMKLRQQQQMAEQHSEAAAMRPPSAPPPQPESMILNRPVTLQPPPATRQRKVTNATSASSPVSHPTPPANTPTPIASASSPANMDNSQATPKSPKTKLPAKRAPVKRRMSKVQPPAALPVASTSSQHGSPSQAKRQREDEAAQPAVDSPSPKRPKTEEQQPVIVPNSNPPPEPEPTIKQEDAEKINTEEDASEFLQNLTDLLEQAGELNEGLNADISEKLDDILRSVPPTGDAMFRPYLDLPEDEDDAGSKAATPDLVSSSSTNPSPESGSESEATSHGIASNEVAMGDNTADLLRLGIWKDIDGGESAYFTGTQGDWKWDKPMPAVEQAWAISTSS